MYRDFFVSLYSTWSEKITRINARNKEICSRHLWSGHLQGLTFKDGSMLIPQCCVLCLSRPPWRTDNVGFVTENDMLALLCTVHIMFPQILNAYWQLALIFVPKTCQQKDAAKVQNLGFWSCCLQCFPWSQSFPEEESSPPRFRGLSYQPLVTNHVKYTRRDICTYGTFKMCFVALHVEVWSVWLFSGFGDYICHMWNTFFVHHCQMISCRHLDTFSEIFPLMFPSSFFGERIIIFWAICKNCFPVKRRPRTVP